MSYSINSITDDCYEGTTCLVNKFGIKNEKQLSEIEADITFAKTSKLEEIPLICLQQYNQLKELQIIS